METKNQMLKILPFNSLNFSDSSVSFSSKSESYKFFPSKQIFGIWAWAVGTSGLLMGLIMWSNVPPIIPKCYTKKLFDFQKIHFYILPVSYFRLMLRVCFVVECLNFFNDSCWSSRGILDISSWFKKTCCKRKKIIFLTVSHLTKKKSWYHHVRRPLSLRTYRPLTL